MTGIIARKKNRHVKTNMESTAQIKCKHTHKTEVYLSHTTDCKTEHDIAMQFYCIVRQPSVRDYTWDK